MAITMRLDGIINECTKRVVQEFHVEWDDCYQQAYVIALEKQREYKETGDASFETFMFHQIYGGLRDYARRYLLREQTGGGKRVPMDDIETLEDFFDEDAISNKLMLEKLRASLDSVSRDILQCIEEGYTQVEIGEMLGISQPAVHKRIKKIAGYISGLEML